MIFFFISVSVDNAIASASQCMTQLVNLSGQYLQVHELSSRTLRSVKNTLSDIHIYVPKAYILVYSVLYMALLILNCSVQKPVWNGVGSRYVITIY